MSAAICGSKRSYFQELPPSPTSSSTSPPLSKRYRCSSSSSPSRFCIPSSLDQLRTIFPQMEIQKDLSIVLERRICLSYLREKLVTLVEYPYPVMFSLQLLERALQECGNDLDAAIKSFHRPCLGSEAESTISSEEVIEDDNRVNSVVDGSGLAPEAVANSPPNTGPEWVELFVREMMNATNVDDARARAAILLEILEKSISERVRAEATKPVKEKIMPKEQIEVLIRENSILKRAVAIQHERQKEYEAQNRELQHLKQLLSQYQEQLITLQVNNYALTMHLKQAQQSNSFTRRTHPDIF